MVQALLDHVFPLLGVASFSDPWLWLLAIVFASCVANAEFHRRFQSSIRSAPRLDSLTEMPDSLPSISVIIPAYNEAVNVTKCLKAVLDNELPADAELKGPFMLFRRTAYDKIGGHASVASNPLEDFALAHEIKSNGLTLRYVLGLDAASVRMYQSFGDLWEGWTKNFHLAGGRNVLTTFFSSGAIALLFTVPWLGLVVGAVGGVFDAPAASSTLVVSGIAVSLQLYMRLSASDVIEQPWRHLWLGWLGGAVVSAIALVSLVKIGNRLGVDVARPVFS